MRKRIILLFVFFLLITYLTAIFISFYKHKENIKDFYKQVIKNNAAEKVFQNNYGKNINLKILRTIENEEKFKKFNEIKSNVAYNIKLKIDSVEHFVKNQNRYGIKASLKKDKKNKINSERFLLIKKNYIKFHKVESKIIPKESIVYMISDSKYLLLSVAKNIGYIYILSLISLAIMIKVILHVSPKLRLGSIVNNFYERIKKLILSNYGCALTELPVTTYVFIFTLILWTKIFSDVKLWYFFYGFTVFAILLLPRIIKIPKKTYLLNNIMFIIIFSIILDQIISRFGYQGSANDAPFIIKVLVFISLSLTIFYYLKDLNKYRFLNILISAVLPLCIIEFRTGTLFVHNFFYLLFIFIPSFIFLSKKLSS